jgi:CheY-like chemotaxis protein
VIEDQKGMGKRQQRRAAEIAAEAAALADEAMVVWRVHSWYRRGSIPFYGAPLRCPDCGALSLVLKVDGQKGFCRNRCTECTKVFVITERSMEAVLSGRLPRPEGVVFPGDASVAEDDAPEPSGAVFGAPVDEPVVAEAPAAPQISWTPPVLQPEPPKADLPPVAWTPPVIDRPSAAAAPAAAAPPPPAVESLPPPPVVESLPPPPVQAPPPPVERPAAALPPPPAVAPPPVAPPAPADPAVPEPAAHRPQGATHAAEVGRRNRRLAAAARRAKSTANDDPTDDGADEADAVRPSAAAPPPVLPPSPPPVVPPTPVSPAGPPASRSSSLFAATPPARPEPEAEDELPVLAPLLQTVAIGGRLVEPSATPQAPSGDLFGAVLVTNSAGAEARLVTPGGPVEPVTSAPAPAAEAPTASAPPPAEPPAVTPPPVLPPRAAAPLAGLPTRERRETLRILMVEDDPADASLAQALFDAAGSDTVQLRVARSRQAGMEVATEFEPHVVLLDLDLPDSHGLATITRWCFSELPGVVVVLSGEYSPVVEQQGREQGVSEFLPKAKLTEWVELGEEGVAAAMALVESLAVREPLA